MKIINSLDNPTIKETVRLKKSSERKEQGLILIDGAREINLAVKAGLEIEKLFYCPGFVKNAEGKKEQVITEATGKFFGVNNDKVFEVSDRVFEKICYKENPDGFLAIARPAATTLEEIKVSSRPLIIVLESVEKPGNLGAILRTAYAVGVEAIIINDNQTDLYNPNVIRASEGQVFTQIVVNATTEETQKWLREKKIRSFGAATSGKKDYTQADFSESAAIILGSEANGLSSGWLKAVDELVKIPMKEGIDSLNVSVSAAVILFETLRQRSGE